MAGTARGGPGEHLGIDSETFNAAAANVAGLTGRAGDMALISVALTPGTSAQNGDTYPKALRSLRKCLRPLLEASWH